MTLVLNLGCGRAVSPSAINIDFDRAMQLHASMRGRFVTARTGRDWSLQRQIRYHDLRNDIPYEDGSVDSVCHSHSLEHLDREYVSGSSPRYDEC
jgi:Methyltransferase domain